MIYDLPKIELKQIEAANKNRLYRIERDRLKTRTFIYLNYPIVNYYGLNISDAKKYIYADFIARFERLLGRNVLFSLGYNNTDSSLLKVSSTLDKPLSSFVASSFSTYQKELKMLELSFDEEKEIIFNGDDYISYIQQVFLFFYDKGIIKLKNGLVVYDENRIYQKGEYYTDGLFNYSLSGKKLKSTTKNFYSLSLNSIKKDLLSTLEKLDINDIQKKCILERFDYKEGLKINCNTTTEKKLEIKMENPEYICGISCVVLNPNYIDIKPFINENEYEEIFEQIYSSSHDLLFSGSYLINPILGNEIPIFISEKYQEKVHVGIPSISEEDEYLVNEYDIEYNPIFDYINEERVLVNSGRYNGMNVLEAKEEISNYLINHLYATAYNECELEELNISSLHKFGIPVPLRNDHTPASLPVVYNLKHDVKLERGELADKFLVKDFLCDEFVMNLLPNAIRLKGDIGILNFESKEALDEIGLFNRINVALFNQVDYSKDLFWILVFNELWRRYYTLGFDSPIIKPIIIKPILDSNLQKMNRENNNLVAVRDVLTEFGSTVLRLYYASLDMNSDSNIFDKFEVEALKELVERIVKVYYYPIDDACTELDFYFEKLTNSCKMHGNNYDFCSYLEEIIYFVNRVHVVKHISRKQAKGLLIILSIITPALAEQLKEDVLNLKEPLFFYSWPE